MSLWRGNFTRNIGQVAYDKAAKSGTIDTAISMSGIHFGFAKLDEQAGDPGRGKSRGLICGPGPRAMGASRAASHHGGVSILRRIKIPAAQNSDARHVATRRT